MLADLRQENADAAAKVLNEAGYDVSTTIVDVSSRESVHALVQTASALGEISGVIHAAGVSPSQASPAAILKVDFYGTALVLEEFGSVIAPGHGRSGEMGQAGRQGQRDQPGVHLHASRLCCPSDGAGRHVQYGQRFSYGRGSNGGILVRRPYPKIMKELSRHKLLSDFRMG
jgi:KR domain